MKRSICIKSSARSSLGHKINYLKTEYESHTILLFQVYTRTGFNKVERMLRVGCDSVAVTVWDTSGLSSYASLRPLVYRDCSVVLLCYAAGGLPGLRGWAAEVGW